MTAAYRYRALRKDGVVERGTLTAASSVDALASVERKGLMPLDVRLVQSSHEGKSALSTSDLSLGLRMLGDLLGAGLPITRALQTMADLAPGSWQRVLPHLRESVKEGKSLSGAFRDAPAQIPPLVIGMTLAGELAGDVGPAIRRAAELTESIAETRAAIRNALAYPAVLAVAGVGAVTLMMTVVIPRFAVILEDLGQSLPPSTRLVMSSATMVRSLFLPALVCLIVAVVVLRAFAASATGRARWHAWLLRFPLLGTIRRSQASAHVALTLATLLESGVPLRSALSFAGRATSDAAIQTRVLAACTQVEAGAPIAHALRQTDAVTPLTVRLLHAGEESGRVVEMLRHAAKLEQQRSDNLTRTAIRFLEPALVLAFAGIVALVAAALLQAVYAVRPTA